MLRSPARFQATARRLVELYRAARATREPRAAASVRRRGCWSQAESLRARHLSRRRRGLLAGAKIGAEASLNKIFWSELDLRMHETALRILGRSAAELLPARTPRARRRRASWLDGYLFALSGPIYAGTNEIQRNIIAERILGLPRG